VEVSSHIKQLFMFRKISKNCSGEIYLEFIGFVAVFFVAMMAVIDYSAVFIAKQKISYLAREAGRVAIKDCRYLSNFEDFTNEAQECLEKILIANPENDNAIITKAVEVFGNSFLNSGYIRIQLWESGDDLVLLGSAESSDSPIFSTFRSQKRVTARANFANTAREHQRIIVSEVYYMYKPITPLGVLLNNRNLIPDTLYGASAF